MEKSLLGNAQNWQRSLCLLSLVILVGLPATALLSEHLGNGSVLTYFIVIFLAFLAIIRFQNRLTRFITRNYLFCLGVTAIGLLLIFAIMYPLETAGKLSLGNDRDECLNIAVWRIIRGQYPYHATSPLGGQINQLPGAFLLASPFVALGNSAYQNIAWAFIFLYATTIYLRQKSEAFLLFIAAFALSPAVQYEYISGGDILANIFYFMTFSLLAFRILPRSNLLLGWKAASIVFLGIGLASRANYLLLIPMLASVLIRKLSWRSGIMITLFVCLITSSLLLPFYLFDPPAFAPFTVSTRYFASFDNLIPASGKLISLATAILAFLGALVLLRSPKNLLEPHFFGLSAIVQLFPLLCGVILTSINSGQTDFSFLHDRHGLAFLFLGMWGCWPFLFRMPLTEDVNL